MKTECRVNGELLKNDQLLDMLTANLFPLVS